MSQKVKIQSYSVALKGINLKKLIKRGTFKEKVHVDMEIISMKDESGYLPIVLHVHGSSAVGGLTFVSLQ